MANIRGLGDLKQGPGGSGPPGGAPGGGGGGGPPGGFNLGGLFGGLGGGGGGPPEEHGNVKVLQQDGLMEKELANAGGKLVVVDFTASWCGPCKQIAPLYAQLSTKYTEVLFLKIDVDQCRGTAQGCGVRAMPTFQFYKNKSKIDEFSGADPGKLQNIIEKYKTADSSSGGAFSGSFSGTGQTLGGGTPSEPSPQPQTAASPPTTQQESGGVNEMFIGALLDMGFPRDTAAKAVAATGGSSVEAAMDWCLSNLGQESDSSMVQEAPQGTSAVNTSADTSATSTTQQDPTPTETMSAEDQAVFQKFMDEDNVGQKVLSPEELEEQKKRVNDLIKVRRAERLKKEAEDEINREKVRRMSGQEAQEAKKKWEEKTRERESFLKKKEQEEDRKAKAAIKAKLESDKLERQALRDKTSAQSTQPQVPQVAPIATEKKEYTESLIQIRLPDGNTVKATFKPTDPIRTVFAHMAMLLGNENFSLNTTFPRKTFSRRDTTLDTTTLADAECVPTGTFILRQN